MRESARKSKSSKHYGQGEDYIQPSTISEFDDLNTSFQVYGTTFDNCREDIHGFYEKYLGDLPEEPQYDFQGESDISEYLESYQQLPIEKWNGDDCYDWASSICLNRSLEVTEVSLWNFRNTTGSTLLQLSLQQFCRIAGDLYGSVLFQDFQNIKKAKRKATRLQRRNTKQEDPTTKWRLKRTESPPSSNLSSPYELSSSTTLDSSSSYFSYPSTSFDNESWDLANQEFQGLDKYIPEEELYSTFSQDFLDLDIKSYLDLDDESSDQNTGLYGIFEEQEPFSSSHIEEAATIAGTENVKSHSKKGVRKPRIYEFLMRLLADTTTNPSLIRWADIDQGTFVLVKPDSIAKLWGARANKPNLSANNFARALRYHYSTGALVAVSEKHFMYKCGQKSLMYLQQLKED
ncbi:AAA ATPase Elf1 [Halocaridina rubra]|uniref:AAA ATPase Elf1 n=1 Tax=Halocaridina rubra TaxID=373956 RepID=A0AAN8WLB1_HALRR